MLEAAAVNAMKGDTRALNAFIALLIRTGHLDQPDNDELMKSLPDEDEAIIGDYVRRQFAQPESPAADNGEVH